MTSRNQGLSSNDQGRQRRETLGTRWEKQTEEAISSRGCCEERKVEREEVELFKAVDRWATKEIKAKGKG